MNHSLVVFGAGGHGRVVLDLAQVFGVRVTCVIDANPVQGHIDGVPVVSHSDPRWTELQDFRFVVAVGDNGCRQRIFESLLVRGGTPMSLVHPRAVVSSQARIGRGVVIMAGVVVNPGAVVGDNAILNTSCSVDHDCVVEDHAHLCPGVRLAGGVQVGCGTMMGTGAVVIPRKRIGPRVVVGAGSVVVSDLPEGSRAWGNPARIQDRAADRF